MKEIRLTIRCSFCGNQQDLRILTGEKNTEVLADQFGQFDILDIQCHSLHNVTRGKDDNSVDREETTEDESEETRD